MGFFNRMNHRIKSIFKDYYIELADTIKEQRQIIEDAHNILVAGDDLIGKDIKFATIEQAEANIIALSKTIDKYLDQQPDVVMTVDNLQKLLVNNRYPMEASGRVYRSSISSKNVYFDMYNKILDFDFRNVDVIELEIFHKFGQKSKFTPKMQKLYDMKLKKKVAKFTDDYDHGLAIYFEDLVYPRHYTQFFYFMHRYLAIMIDHVETNKKPKIMLRPTEIDFLKFLKFAENPQGFFVVSKD